MNVARQTSPAPAGSEKRVAWRRVLAMPWYVLSVLTSAKSFRDNPVIGNAKLNRMGLHVWRVKAAHAVFAFRQKCLSSLIDAEDAKSYREQGYLLIENFLDDAEFKALQDEVASYRGEVFETVQGDTMTWRALLDRENLSRLPRCRALSQNGRFRRLLSWCAGRHEMPLFYIERIFNNRFDVEPDPQKKLHSDTFHPTMKAWLFLEDVGEDDGPFTYVPGSHRLTPERLQWERERSINAAAAGLDNVYAEKGSLRVEEDELAGLGMQQPKACAVKANTLVIANTFGFHRRGDAKPDSPPRLELWAMSRVNPFNPWPGLGTTLHTRIRDWIFLKYLRRTRKTYKDSGIVTDAA